MTTGSGDQRAVTSAPEGLPRRRLLVMGLGAALGGAAALAARPLGAQAAGPTLDGLTIVGEDASTRPDVAGDWFAQTVAVATPTPGVPLVPGVFERVWAISWVSALAALDAGTDRPSSARRRRPFEDAAVASAVHDALAAQLPDQASRLDAALARSLAAIPDGDAKQAGIRAGQDAAARTLRDRDGDGFDPASLNRPYTPPPEAPGVYRLPPGATQTQGAGLGEARPFLLGRADRFRLDVGAPPALATSDYRHGLDEVQRFGGVVSERTEHQSDIAWLAPQMQYTPALRGLVRGPGHSLSWKVSLQAAYATATADSQIAVADAKFAYLHWRPVTAIRAAETDGDPLTQPDPTWSSYVFTPWNPDWPSGHAAFAGAAEHVLEYFTGPRTPIPITATIPRGDGWLATLEYRRGTPWSVLTQDNVDARVWAGVHFRFSDEAGARLGRSVGDYDLQRLDPRRRWREPNEP
jgi:hypothetical protein